MFLQCGSAAPKRLRINLIANSLLVEFVGLPGLWLIVGILMPLCGLRLLFALGTLSLVEVRWGRASIPKLCFLFFSMWQVGVSKCMDCSRAVGWWTPNLWFVVSVFR